GLIGDRCRDNRAVRHFDTDMSGGGTFRHFDNLALEAIACADFHALLLKTMGRPFSIARRAVDRPRPSSLAFVQKCLAFRRWFPSVGRGSAGGKSLCVFPPGG